MRSNNRQNSQLRQVKIIRKYTKHAEGSVLVCFGDTHVLCTATVIHKLPYHLKNSNTGWITAEYGMLPRSTNIRMDRESAKGKQTGRTQEIQRLIGRSLRACINLEDIKDYTIHLDCDVIQADGGTRTASITGAWIALYDAVEYMFNNKMLSKKPSLKKIAAVSIGILRDEILIDLDYIEDSSCDTDLNLVMCEGNSIIEIQGTAEGTPFSNIQLQKMIDIAQQGISELFIIQTNIINT